MEKRVLVLEIEVREFVLIEEFNILQGFIEFEICVLY